MNSPELVTQAAITYRQLDYWTRRGWLHPANGTAPGTGFPRDWPDSERDIAQAMGALTAYGIPPELSHDLARQHRAADMLAILRPVPARSRWLDHLRECTLCPVDRCHRGDELAAAVREHMARGETWEGIYKPGKAEHGPVSLRPR